MDKTICWIETPEEESLGATARAAFDRVRRRDETVHNLYRAFAVWPSALPAADAFYRAILHAPDGPLVMAERELIATQVAILTACGYAEAHHGANFVQVHGEPAVAEAILGGLRSRDYPDPPFDRRLGALARYTEKLTLAPEKMDEEDVEALRAAGLDDAEILHLNQVAASFSYWSRVINGLGIRLGDEAIGLDPETLAALAEPGGT